MAWGKLNKVVSLRRSCDVKRHHNPFSRSQKTKPNRIGQTEEVSIASANSPSWTLICGYVGFSAIYFSFWNVFSMFSSWLAEKPLDDGCLWPLAVMFWIFLDRTPYYPFGRQLIDLCRFSTWNISIWESFEGTPTQDKLRLEVWKPHRICVKRITYSLLPLSCA